MIDKNTSLVFRFMDRARRLFRVLPRQNITVKFAVFAVVCVACLQWTRLTGTVKGINLKDSTVTIQNRDGDLLTVPVDYQVKLIEKHGEMRDLKHLQLDEKITLVNTPADKPKEDEYGLQPPEPNQR